MPSSPASRGSRRFSARAAPMPVERERERRQVRGRAPRRSGRRPGSSCEGSLPRPRAAGRPDARPRTAPPRGAAPPRPSASASARSRSSRSSASASAAASPCGTSSPVTPSCDELRISADGRRDGGDAAGGRLHQAHRRPLALAGRTAIAARCHRTSDLGLLGRPGELDDVLEPEAAPLRFELVAARPVADQDAPEVETALPEDARMRRGAPLALERLQARDADELRRGRAPRRSARTGSCRSRRG